MAQNEKGGSDLDVFEGLGKKSATSRPPSGTLSVPPPPPAATRAAQDPGKRTLVGIVGSLSAPSAPAGSSPAVTALRTPPPPPGRSTLPPVVSPPSAWGQGARSAPSSASADGTTPLPEEPQARPFPQPDKATAAIDVSWDEDDETTHIFDDNAEPLRVAGGVPLPSPTIGKSTLLGMASPSFSGLPPPPTGGAGRPAAASKGSAFPTGVTGGSLPAPPVGHPLPPPPGTQPGLGMNYSTRNSSMPPGGHAASPPTATSIPRAPGIPDYLAPQRGMESTALVRPPPGRTGLWIAVGLAAAAMLAVAVVFLGTARTGRLVVNVADAKGAAINRADIYVDGRKQCDTPCKVEQLGAGSHEVKVVADGFETPAVQTVSVDPRQDATVNFTLSGGTSLSGLRVAGNQPGVKLYVDDREAGPLPQEVRDLAPGPHTIRVAGSDRYQPLEKQVAVEKDSVSDLGTVTLKVLRGKATITLTTLGARVYLVSGSDRRELPTLPISVDIDTTKTWSLEASKPGYDDLRQPISFDDGQAEKSFVVALDPHTAPPLQAYQAPQPQAVQVQAQAPSPQPTPAAQPPTPAQAPPTEAGEAFLNINSIPPSTCFVDGHSLGSTPRLHISVKPGSHTVKFINADQGLTKTITVSVGAGETKPAVAKLN